MSEAGQNSYLSDEVRRYDYDRWLTAIFAPTAAREGVFALLAFHAEIARIRETVSEPMLGDIRLQWWRDALNSIAGGTSPAHPVAEALARIIPAHNLDIGDFQTIIDARAYDLDPLPFQTVAELLRYSEQTGGVLNSLFLRITGVTDGEGLTAARQVGKAYAFLGIIRSVPYHVAQDVLRIPAEMIAAKGLTPDTLFTSKNREVFFEIMRELTELAEGEQAAARELMRTRPKSEKSAYRLAALTTLYLNRLRSTGSDPAHEKMDIGALRKILALTFGR
ncbi:phytoene/squalene synthase family protein [Sneathiella sp.]|uniref:phytoene/squalene synthase family protein n=1 Tax=Sneathiella sp. TaxID=1964365 RepID=UPI00261ED8AC|nr:phytoene/squalene synthase family protein [Sneathiella sp.]MDF2367311.1 phytoene/squalene synthase family protein [Sneathiella sp.]